MAFEFEIFADEKLQSDYIEWLIDECSHDMARQFNKLWEYYVNRSVETLGLSAADRKVNESGRCYIQAQEYGLPSRITGLARSAKAGMYGGDPITILLAAMPAATSPSTTSPKSFSNSAVV